MNKNANSEQAHARHPKELGHARGSKRGADQLQHGRGLPAPLAGDLRQRGRHADQGGAETTAKSKAWNSARC